MEKNKTNKQTIKDKNILQQYREKRANIYTELNATENKFCALQKEYKDLDIQFNEKYIEKLDNTKYEYTKFQRLLNFILK